jgi:hypothetical protein
MSTESETAGREDEDLRILRNAAARLMEHFDTRHIGSDEGTIAAQHGEGNWYARRGQVGEWLVKQDADASND